MWEKVKAILTARPEVILFFCGLVLGAFGGWSAQKDCVTDIDGSPIIENPWKKWKP